MLLLLLPLLLLLHHIICSILYTFLLRSFPYPFLHLILYSRSPCLLSKWTFLLFSMLQQSNFRRSNTCVNLSSSTSPNNETGPRKRYNKRRRSSRVIRRRPWSFHGALNGVATTQWIDEWDYYQPPSLIECKSKLNSRWWCWCLLLLLLLLFMLKEKMKWMCEMNGFVTNTCFFVPFSPSLFSFTPCHHHHHHNHHLVI